MKFPASRYCPSGSVPHLAKKGQIYCRPHLSAELKKRRGKTGEVLDLLFKNIYTKPIKSLVRGPLPMDREPHPRDPWVTPVTLSREHGFVFNTPETP